MLNAHEEFEIAKDFLKEAKVAQVAGKLFGESSEIANGYIVKSLDHLTNAVEVILSKLLPPEVK